MRAEQHVKKQMDNPFDLITRCEEEEHKRTTSEIMAMQKEGEEVKRALTTKEEEYEQHLRAQAKKELEEFRRTTLQEMLKTGEHEATKESADLDRIYVQRKPKIIEDIVARVFQHFS